MEYEQLHDACTESLRKQWLEHTNHGRLYQELEDYDSDLCLERYARVCNRLEGRRADYVDDNFGEEMEIIMDAMECDRDPYAYYGVRRSDF